MNMGAHYLPSSDVVLEHVEHLQRTAHLPRWQRGDASLELLLGLRDASVDAQLRKIVPVLNADGDLQTATGPRALEQALADRSVQRIARLVLQTISARPLAWLTPTADEVDLLTSELPVALLRDPRFLRFPPAIFSSICDLAVRGGRREELERLAKLPLHGWLAQKTLAAALGRPFDAPQLIEQSTPSWLPTLPPALFRDPMTGLLSRSVLYEDPHRVGLPDWSRIVRLPGSAVIMIDVDRMKTILDVRGMRSGDSVLIALGEHFQSLFGDRAIRFGGDEFLVIWERDDVADVAQVAVESVRTLKISCSESPTEQIPTTVSAGIASGTDVLAVLHAAEEALARAKANGRDQVC